MRSEGCCVLSWNRSFNNSIGSASRLAKSLSRSCIRRSRSCVGSDGVAVCQLLKNRTVLDLQVVLKENAEDFVATCGLPKCVVPKSASLLNL